MAVVDSLGVHFATTHRGPFAALGSTFQLPVRPRRPQLTAPSSRLGPEGGRLPLIVSCLCPRAWNEHGGTRSWAKVESVGK